MSSAEIVLILSNLDKPEDSPVERLEVIHEILDRLGDVFPEVVFPLVVPVLQEMYSDFKRIGDISALSYIKSMCEVYHIHLNMNDTQPTPYEDKESVHVFMQDTRQIVEWLMEKYPPEKYIRMFNNPFIDFIERTFIPVVGEYTLVDIFTSVMKFIQSSDHTEELIKILKNEMEESKDSCVSGHLSAMVNTIMGFPGVPECKGNSFEHQKASIFNLLNKTLNFDDIDNLEDDIGTIINSRDISEFAQLENLPRILKDYTKVDWKLTNDGKLTHG